MLFETLSETGSLSPAARLAGSEVHQPVHCARGAVGRTHLAKPGQYACKWRRTIARATSYHLLAAGALVLMAVALLPTVWAAPAQQATFRSGAVVELRDTPHLWIADEQGVLHWGGDTRGLAGRLVDWGNRITVSLGDLRTHSRGDPWLSAGLLKWGDPIYLVKWETEEARPRLLHILTIADVELFGINSNNYGLMVLDKADWERRFGFAAETLERGVLAPAVTPTPSPAATSSTATATPTPTPTAATPSPTPTSFTPTPTATATPTAPVNLSFRRPDGGNGSAVDNEPFSQAHWAYTWSPTTTRGEVQAWALVNFGSFEHPRATSYVYNDFVAATRSARVSADITWNGRFIQAGVLGARAASTINLQVLDSGGRVIATELVHEREVGDTLVSGGTIGDNGQRSVVLSTSLTPGATYRVRLLLTCEAESGLLAVVTACTYSPSTVAGESFNGYVRWTRLDVLWD